MWIIKLVCTCAQRIIERKTSKQYSCKLNKPRRCARSLCTWACAIYPMSQIFLFFLENHREKEEAIAMLDYSKMPCTIKFSKTLKSLHFPFSEIEQEMLELFQIAIIEWTFFLSNWRKNVSTDEVQIDR